MGTRARAPTLEAPPQQTEPRMGPAERDALFQELQPLVARLIRQYGDDPDLRQELPAGIYCRFCRLVEHFDPSRGTPVKAYLVRTLPAAVYTFARAYWRRCRRESSLSPEVESELLATAADPSQE